MQAMPQADPLPASDDEIFSPSQIEFFENKVYPILVEYCFECHGPDSTPIEGVQLADSEDALLEGGDTKLTDEDICTLTEWIEDGAAWPGDAPIANIRPAERTNRLQRNKLDFVNRLDNGSLKNTDPVDQLESAIENYELACRMQSAVPDLASLDGETEAMREMYGLNSKNKHKATCGRQCLRARRLKQRGMLDDTLVIWSGGFGRTPFAQGSNGRDHNPFGFSLWMAGGGIKGGVIHGATDEYDLHATMLHLLGMDHEKLTCRWSGRDMRLIDVAGNVIKEVLA